MQTGNEVNGSFFFMRSHAPDAVDAEQWKVGKSSTHSDMRCFFPVTVQVSVSAMNTSHTKHTAKKPLGKQSLYGNVYMQTHTVQEISFMSQCTFVPTDR